MQFIYNYLLVHSEWRWQSPSWILENVHKYFFVNFFKRSILSTHNNENNKSVGEGEGERVKKKAAWKMAFKWIDVRQTLSNLYGDPYEWMNEYGMELNNLHSISTSAHTTIINAHISRNENRMRVCEIHSFDLIPSSEAFTHFNTVQLFNMNPKVLYSRCAWCCFWSVCLLFKLNECVCACVCLHAYMDSGTDNIHNNMGLWHSTCKRQRK